MNKHTGNIKMTICRCMSAVLVSGVIITSSVFGVPQSSGDVLKAESKVNIGKKKLYMYEGQSVKLKNKKYTWKSSDKKVVTVNKKGKIKAKKAGTAKVTASKKIGKKIRKATCKIYVGKYARDISLMSAQSIVLKKGQTSTIKANVMPVKVLYKDLIYVSENTDIATVNEQGIITPLSTGITKIQIKSKAVTKKKNNIVKSVTVVVLGDYSIQTPEPTEAPGDNKDLFDDIGDGGFVVVTPTPGPKETAEPTPSATPDNSAETTTGPTVSPTTSPTATPGNNDGSTISPTVSPAIKPTKEPTIDPTPSPTTIAEYIATLTPDPDHPLVGSFVVTNAAGSVRTIYLLNKEYAGKMKLQIDSYTYGSESSVSSILKELENERMSVKNSAGTIHVYRKKTEDPWRVCFLQENITYMFSAKQQDTIWGSNYGVIISEGNTLDNIKILIN